MTPGCHLIGLLWAVGALALSLAAASTTEDLSISSILEGHARIEHGDTARSFPGPTLIYVTPWYSKGYDLAKRFRGCKFDRVSPVWYQLRAAGGVLQLAGRHDVDAGWMAAVSEPCEEGGRRSNVLPRVLVELAPTDVAEMLIDPSDFVRILVGEAQARGFDGWVLEAWSYWAALGATTHPEVRQQALHAVRRLSQALQKAGGKELVLAVSPLVPAPGRPAQLTPADVHDLLPLVAGLSVMTYDYSSPQQPGPNAPLHWVRSNAEALAEAARGSAAKVWLGLHFYGNEYRFRGKQPAGHDAVVGQAFLERLAAHGGGACSGGSSSGGTCAGGEEQDPEAVGGAAGGGGMEVRWVEASQEPLFKWKERAEEGGKARTTQHFLYYPLPRSLGLRLAEARARGMGVAVWEAGQGVDCFYDLL